MHYLKYVLIFIKECFIKGLYLRIIIFWDNCHLLKRSLKFSKCFESYSNVKLYYTN